MEIPYGIIKGEVRKELEGNILPFWIERMQDPSGGFFGRMDGKGVIDPEAPKGAILNARILWTFSSAGRILGRKDCLETAGKAFAQIRDCFYDKEFGGVYWSLYPDGRPMDAKKQFYAIAFAVYGCSEYFRATGDEEALEMAIKLWRSIEDHSLDTVKGGYLEACTRDWQPIEDMRLSEKDRNDAKTMNTHLHILEGYTGLYRVWKDETLRRRLVELCGIIMDRIVRPDGHLGLFFDEDWVSRSDTVSYGHDIEASWLLCETAELLDDPGLLARVRGCCTRIAEASLEGLRPDGSMVYEDDDADRHWWVQAETVVGCLNQAMLCPDGDSASIWFRHASDCWEYIKNHLMAPDGEWYWSIRADGTVNTDDDRAGFWKCPYHNGRMCMEILESLQ